jgi:hypothetical protein
MDVRIIRRVGKVQPLYLSGNGFFDIETGGPRDRGTNLWRTRKMAVTFTISTFGLPERSANAEGVLSFSPAVARSRATLGCRPRNEPTLKEVESTARPVRPE